MSSLLMSDSINELSAALNEFQKQVVTVERSVTNPFFRAKYADLASIMVESQPILTEHGLSVSQFPDTLDNDEAGLTTILMHTSGQFIRATVPLPVSRVKITTQKEKTQQKPDTKETVSDGYDPQEFGRAITYMRRYGYAAVLQIVIDEDDDGNKSSRRHEKPKPSDPKIVEEIQTLWKTNGGTEESLVTWVKKNNNDMLLEQLPGDRQAALLMFLKNRKTGKSEKSTETPESLAADDAQNENPGADPGNQENK